MIQEEFVAEVADIDGLIESLDSGEVDAILIDINLALYAADMIQAVDNLLSDQVLPHST